MERCNISRIQFSCSQRSIFISISLFFPVRVCDEKELPVEIKDCRWEKVKKEGTVCEAEMCRGLSGHQYFRGWSLGWIIQPWCHAVSLTARLLAWSHTHTLSPSLFLSEMEVALQNRPNLLQLVSPLSLISLPSGLHPIVQHPAGCWVFIISYKV